jgi:hypothetical protein
MKTKNIIKEKNLISPEFITEVCHRLADDKQVRRTLPKNGRLHIDRSLPFLCVYRRPLKQPDQGTSRLVEGEASYLIYSESGKFKKEISDLLNSVVNILAMKYGAFLIIEIWATTIYSDPCNSEINLPCPEFQIRIPPGKIPTETVESLENGLKRITMLS